MEPFNYKIYSIELYLSLVKPKVEKLNFPFISNKFSFKVIHSGNISSKVLLFLNFPVT